MTVSDLFASVLQRLEVTPQCGVLEAVKRVQTIITNRLILKRSSLIKDILPVSVSSGDEYVPLSPSGGRGFLAMASAPYLDGRQYLQPYDDAIVVSATGKPKYYQRVGRKLYLYPLPDADYDMNIPAFVSPPVIETMDEDLPFDGLLDDVFSEAVYGVMLNGTSAVADKAFTAGIDSQVDQVILATDMADEQTMADSINYR